MRETRGSAAPLEAWVSNYPESARTLVSGASEVKPEAASRPISVGRSLKSRFYMNTRIKQHLCEEAGLSRLFKRIGKRKARIRLPHISGLAQARR